MRHIAAGPYSEAPASMTRYNGFAKPILDAAPSLPLTSGGT